MSELYFYDKYYDNYIDLIKNDSKKLILKLKMRDPKFYWKLDFSVDSLQVIDRQVEINSKLSMNNEGILEISGINQELILEITAYLGEILKRNFNGKWVIVNENGKKVLYIYYVSKNDYRERYDQLILYEEIQELIIEGESIEKWFRKQIG
jgi:hypothetical protein